MSILQRHLPPGSQCNLHLSKHLRRFERSASGEIVMYFEDGTEAKADILVGADGVRSAARKVMYEVAAKQEHPLDTMDAAQHKAEEYANAKWTGHVVYRNLVPRERLVERHPDHLALREMLFFCGQGKHVVSYPVNNGANINVAGFVANPGNAGRHFEGRWVENVPGREFTEHFDGWEPQVRQLVELCERPSRWALHVTEDLPFYTSGNAVLIGDAAHAMEPHIGAGAGQAIEDAYILGRLLAHAATTLDRLPQALKIYEDVRMSYARQVAEDSKANGVAYEFLRPGHAGCARTTEILGDEARVIRERWGRTVQSGAVEEWREAERRLLLGVSEGC